MAERDYRKTGIEAYGEKCAVCGDEEDVIHHRDGDSSNNEVANLIPLCNPCHQKVHAGKAINDTAAELIDDLGKPVREDGETTTIQISDKLADELYEEKGRAESYADVIWELIDAENE